MVTLKDIQQARSLLRGIAVRTPLVLCKLSDSQQIFIKPENLQPIGSFKLRGGYNKISSLTAEERKRGVVAQSRAGSGIRRAGIGRESDHRDAQHRAEGKAGCNACAGG
jgi:threonine dehydratase